MAHVHAETVAEMIPQVGEGARRALEVCARHLHTLDTHSRGPELTWEEIQLRGRSDFRFKHKTLQECSVVCVPPQILGCPWLPALSAKLLQRELVSYSHLEFVCVCVCACV